MKKILVTGAAGFIGFHYAKALCAAGHEVLGIDCVNDYYDPKLKKDRLAELQPFQNFEFRKVDLANRETINAIFADWKPQIVVNLAAQAGVRYSIENPHAYIDANLVGFTNILEGCRHNEVEHLIFASSSSVYGANEKVPFSVSDPVNHPVSLYAATKKANELMAHSYAHLYNLPVTGLRFFTVYGPWGRPDMAYYKFTKAIYEGEPIDIYNKGDMMRDFTYIDDIVEAMMRLIDHTPNPNPEWNAKSPDPASSNAPYRLYNIGNNSPEKLMDMIAALENAIGIEAKKNYLPMQAGDVPATFADTSGLEAEIDFKPATPLKTGLAKFVNWYTEYYGVGHNSRKS
ncbi:MAG: NAD-dependent epimerase [Alphaproteobacteria bacterium]